MNSDGSYGADHGHAEQPQHSDAPGPPSPAGDLSHRLRALVDWYSSRYGIRLSNHDIARGITANGGRISHTTVAALLNGSNDNPQLRTVFDLASFFGVDPGYFVTHTTSDVTAVEDVDSAEQRLHRLAQTSPKAAQQVALLTALKEMGATTVAARGFVPTDNGLEAMLRIVRGVGKLSDDGRNAVAGVVEAMQRAHTHDPDLPAD